MELNVTWYIDCSHLNLGCCLGNQCFTWPLYERDLTTDALTNDLDDFQFALCNGDTTRAPTVMQIPRRYAHCALKPINVGLILKIQENDIEGFDGYHTIKSVQDELCLENTTLFCTLGFQNDCICNCLQIGYKDKRVFIKRNNDSLPSDCVFLTRWPYSHSPKDIHYEKKIGTTETTADCEENWCICMEEVKFIKQHSFNHTFSLPPS